jgi:sialic acid synthase SpsE
MFNQKIKLGPKQYIGKDSPCFIIAEIGSNHNNNLKLAYRLIDEAKKTGADAVKFQTFSAEKHFSKFAPGFSYLKNKPMFDLIKSLEINRNWHSKLIKYCNMKKIIFFSSPCDYEAVDQLYKLGVRIFKIASFDITDLELVDYISKKKATTIISTGLASYDDIKRAVSICKKNKNRNIVLLQCTSLYPTPKKLVNLKCIESLRKKYKCLTGFSDHTLEGDSAIASIPIGSVILEKHLTLSKKLKGPDHKFAMEPKEFTEMVKSIRNVEEALGNGIKGLISKEEKEMHLKGRRSLHFSRDINKGEKLTKKDFCIKRPGLGIKPFLLNKIIGLSLKQKVKKDQWVTYKMLRK